MQEDPLIVLMCTVPDEEIGDTLARGLVESRLAACVHVVPGIRSHYVWQGVLERAAEVQLVIKTRLGRFEEIRRWLEDRHPYDVPEVVAIPVTKVSRAYGSWVSEQTREPPELSD